MELLFFVSVVVAVVATWYFFKKVEAKNVEPSPLKPEEISKVAEQKLDEEYLPKPVAKKKTKKNG